MTQIATLPSPCTWCPSPATHELDHIPYCCPCFDQLVEHCGNVKSIPSPHCKLDEETLHRLQILHARLNASRRAAFHASRMIHTRAQREPSRDTAPLYEESQKTPDKVKATAAGKT